MGNDNSIIIGKVYILDDNIDTDLIIPAEYLNLVPTIPDEYRKLGSYALSGLPNNYARFIKDWQVTSEYSVIVAGKNFGCGSSREHAVTALAAAGIKAVVAESYARIFFRNAVATGELYPMESEKTLRNAFKLGTQIEVNTNKGTITDIASQKVFKLKPLGAVGPVVAAGGIFGYARATGMISKKK
ncbi:MAG: 3-isopropylmalate dehydratase [Kiritimatiellae bacterium]|nr:3-isopropylmalate dehydratase [Kiritimatiellia bacterium]MDD5520751.1 3-isopropylmalate dehydratase [Kiritimatiellia bacterium]